MQIQGLPGSHSEAFTPLFFLYRVSVYSHAGPEFSVILLPQLQVLVLQVCATAPGRNLSSEKQTNLGRNMNRSSPQPLVTPVLQPCRVWLPISTSHPGIPPHQPESGSVQEHRSRLKRWRKGHFPQKHEDVGKMHTQGLYNWSFTEQQEMGQGKRKGPPRRLLPEQEHQHGRRSPTRSRGIWTFCASVVIWAWPGLITRAIILGYKSHSVTLALSFLQG